MEPNWILYTSEQDKCIEWCYRHHTYDIPKSIYRQFRVAAEMNRWLTLEGVTKIRRLHEHRHISLPMSTIEVWTDASGYAGGSVHTICDDSGQLKTYSTTYHWPEAATTEAINFKELVTIELTLLRFGIHYENKRVNLMCDNSWYLYG